jgi:hypothetical protein
MLMSFMTSLTLSVTKELRKKMNQFPEINWSEIARQAIIKRLGLLEKMDKLLSKSELTEEEALRLGRKVNKRISKMV